jgi:RNA polymerase sigma-70 factor, ECF subfamily
MQSSAEHIVDQILVMDAQIGRREAFEMLVSRWQKRLWRYAYNLIGRTEAAWDITQESWLDIVRGLGRLKDPAKFGAWAYRIVSNKARDWLSRNGRELSLDIEPEDPQASTTQQVQHETARDVHDILRLLSVRSQMVLNF